LTGEKEPDARTLAAGTDTMAIIVEASSG